MEYLARLAAEVSVEFDKQVAAVTAFVQSLAAGTGADPSAHTDDGAGDAPTEEDDLEALGLNDRDLHALRQLRELLYWDYLTQEEYDAKEAHILKTVHDAHAAPPAHAQTAPRQRTPSKSAADEPLDEGERTQSELVADKRASSELAFDVPVNIVPSRAHVPVASPPSPTATSEPTFTFAPSRARSPAARLPQPAARSPSAKPTSPPAPTGAQYSSLAAAMTPSAPTLAPPAPPNGTRAPSPGRGKRGADRPAGARQPSHPPSTKGLQGAPNPYDGGDKDKSTRQMFDKRQLRRDKARSYIPAIAAWRASQLDGCASFSLPNGNGTADARRQALRVFIRKRPMFEREEAKGDYEVVSVPSPRDEGSAVQQLVVHNCLTEADLHRMFIRNIAIAGHGVFGDGSTSEDVYEAMARPLVSRAVDGGISTIFSFGQTGSGKTFTCNAIEEMASAQVFEEVHAACALGDDLAVSLVFVEIFGNHVADLLTKSVELIALKEDAKGTAQLIGATKQRVHSAAELVELIEACKRRRKTEKTAQNATSSRSHAMLQIYVEEVAAAPAADLLCTDAPEPRTKRADRSARPWHAGRVEQSASADAGRCGKLVLVDLAGTERKEDSMWHTAERRKEGAQINASLYALKECMRAMGGKSSALVPYKANALTRALAESFTAENAMTAVLATVSPGSTDTEHTLHTLHTVTAMCGIDHLTSESRSEVAEYVNAEEVALAPSLHPPAKWTHERVKEWMGSAKGGQFKAQAAILPAHVDGPTIVKEPVFWFKQVLCAGDEKQANRLYAALREEVSQANKRKYEHAQRLAKLRG